MDKFYAVYNTRRNEFVALGLCTLQVAKDEATRLNQAMKPEYQNYTVVTVTFDTEI